MAARPVLMLAVCGLTLTAVACGGDNTSTAPSTTAISTTIAAATVPVTEPVTTEPPTTLPTTLDLSELPGRLAVYTQSCTEEPPVLSPTFTGVICILNPDGTDAQALSQPGDNAQFPTFTYDGKYLLFADLDQGEFIVDLATNTRRLREPDESIKSGVSPDGQWIVYFDENHLSGITVSHSDLSPFPDGSTFQTVVDDVWSGGPTWSPDSTHFAYVSHQADHGQTQCPDLWIGSREGTPPVQLTYSATGADPSAGCPTVASWSPDGTKILLRTLGWPYGSSENLYLINPDGSDLTALTHSGEPDPNIATYFPEGSSQAAAWSPDGAQIAFVMSDGETNHLYVMNADGSQVTRVDAVPAELAANIVYIAWAPG